MKFTPICAYCTQTIRNKQERHDYSYHGSNQSCQLDVYLHKKCYKKILLSGKTILSGLKHLNLYNMGRCCECKRIFRKKDKTNVHCSICEYERNKTLKSLGLKKIVVEKNFQKVVKIDGK